MSTGSASRVAAAIRVVPADPPAGSVSSDSNRSSWLSGAAPPNVRQPGPFPPWPRTARPRQSGSSWPAACAAHARRRRRTDAGPATGLLFQLGQLLLEAGGHVVERGVASAASSSVPRTSIRSLELAGRQPVRALGRQPHRNHDPPGHQPGDRGEEEHHGDTDNEQGALHAGVCSPARPPAGKSSTPDRRSRTARRSAGRVLACCWSRWPCSSRTQAGTGAGTFSSYTRETSVLGRPGSDP